MAYPSLRFVSRLSFLVLVSLSIALAFVSCPTSTSPTPPGPGDLDTTFLATGAGATGAVNSIAVQSDGKVLIGGLFTSYNGTSRGYVARLNTDGSLDTGFLATGAGANGLVYSVAVQPGDGKILIGGGFTTYNGTSRGFVARLLN